MFGWLLGNFLRFLGTNVIRKYSFDYYFCVFSRDVKESQKPFRFLLRRGELHIDLCTYCVIMTLRIRGKAAEVSLMMF